MVQGEGVTDPKLSQANFLGTLALVLLAVAVLFPLVILIAAVT